MTDLFTARDDMAGLLIGAYAAINWAAMPSKGPIAPVMAPKLYFQGRGSPDSPAADIPHVRYFCRHADGYDASLTDDAKRKLYGREGLIIIQCFGPLGRGDGLEVALYLAIIAQQAYEGKSSPNCVWFRNCRIQEEGPSGSWEQVNVYISFQYDEVG